jgi:hypothetical protein
VKVWELESGRLLRSLEGHTDGVWAVAVSPDGRFIVSGSEDRTVKVWELESGRLLRSLEGHTDWVNAVAVSPDGRFIVSGSSDHTVKVWELESGRLLRSLEGHTGWVNGRWRSAPTDASSSAAPRTAPSEPGNRKAGSRACSSGMMLRSSAWPFPAMAACWPAAMPPGGCGCSIGCGNPFSPVGLPSRGCRDRPLGGRPGRAPLLPGPPASRAAPCGSGAAPQPAPPVRPDPSGGPIAGARASRPFERPRV